MYSIGMELQTGVTYDMNFDSITDVPKDLKIRYIRIVGMPGLYITVSPLHTKLTARRQDAGTGERASMDLAIRRIESYLTKRKIRSLFNALGSLNT